MDTVTAIVFDILGWILFKIKGVIVSEGEEKLERATAFSQDFFKEILPLFLEKMKQRNEVNLFAINNAKAKFQAPDESVRYKAEASLDFDAYVASLQSKDKIIDDTIEKHYETLLKHEKISNKANKQDQKLKQLKDNAQELVGKDERMRMQNLTQSYDIADSALFEDISELRNIIGLDPEYQLEE